MIPAQFAKTLEALETAEKEMSELWDTLESLETVLRATYAEVETAQRFRRELRGMMSSVTAMLEKRENAILQAVRLTQAVDDASIERHGKTIDDDRIYSETFTGATPRCRPNHK